MNKRKGKILYNIWLDKGEETLIRMMLNDDLTPATFLFLFRQITDRGDFVKA